MKSMRGIRLYPFKRGFSSMQRAAINAQDMPAVSPIELAFTTKMKELRKQKSPKSVIKAVEESCKFGNLTPSMSFMAMKTLTNMNRTDLLPNMIPFWQQSVTPDLDLSGIGNISCSVVRLYSKLHLIEYADIVAASVGVTLDSTLHSIDNTTKRDLFINILPELTVGYISTGDIQRAQSALEVLAASQLRLPNEVSKKILKQFLLHANSESIRRALRTLLKLSNFNDIESIQMITNYYLRKVEFKTGAVTMNTLPAPNCSEICFIGRSNVGKSSLINMLCNRKSLAYTSKTPGKTSEFNYFESVGVAGASKQPHRFYLVDLPGVGFARKTRELRQGWAALLREYATGRENLRAVYHLVDSRHGLLEADEECLALLPALSPLTQYVILLTKADKQSDTEKVNLATQAIINRIHSEVAKYSDRTVPVILTSAESKRGGVRVLSHMLDAVAGFDQNSSRQ